MSPSIKEHSRGILAFLALILMAAVYLGITRHETQIPVACTMDAKQCPDGSYVGRVAPLCNFAACPVPLSNVPSNTPTIPQSGTFIATSTQNMFVTVGTPKDSATVKYSGLGFLPATTTVKQYQSVDFTNNSNTSFWLEINPDYHDAPFPEFDSRSGITPGNKFTVVFTNAGIWHYRNKLSTSTTGVIIVQAVATTTKAGSITATSTAKKGTMKFN